MNAVLETLCWPVVVPGRRNTYVILVRREDGWTVRIMGMATKEDA